MANENTIKSKQNELKKIKHHLDWTELEINKVYHIPPIITIERMDIEITAIDGDDIKFKRVDSTTDKTEKSMKKTSILSRFLVKKLKY
jgi:hypothetical protein